MDYSGYQQQQQQAYDPSQIQAYDQTTQSYYGYNQQYDQQYAYFSSQDQRNPYAQQAHQQFQQEPTAIHPPGVPILPEQARAAGRGQTQMQNQQNVHYLPGVSENQQKLNPDSGAAVAGSMNPTAVAALSQFTHFAGNVDVAQRATHPPIGQSQYRGGGGRGSRPFRRGGRGQFNHRGRALYRGRGRGRGGGRHFPSHSSGPANSNVEYASAAAEVTSVAQPLSVPGQISLPILAQVPTASVQPPPRKAWCEICKVECNTPEILEQHKNGKRHKKNLQVYEGLQRLKAVNGQQSGQMPTSQLNLTVQDEKLQEPNNKGCPAENMGSEATDDNLKGEIEQPNNIEETSEVPADEPGGNPRDNFPRGRGLKRKMRGRGGKYMRTNDGSRRPVEPPKPKQAIPFICELCNVKCESQVVYDSHLTGKKHLSILKRVHGHQAMYSEAGLQALYPTDISALANSINSQVQQGVSDPQVLLAQLLMTVLTQAQVPAIALPSGSVAAQISALTPAAGSSYEPQFQNVLQTQVSESTAHGGSENPTGETKSQLLSAPAGLSTNTKTAGGSSETEENVLKLPQNGSVSTPAENPSAANDQVPSSECKASTS